MKLVCYMYDSEYTKFKNLQNAQILYELNVML